MAQYDYDLGIIGGGAAGLTAAAGGAQFGAKTMLIEKAGTLGGDCLHFGCVPSKTLLRTAGIWAQARRTSEFGLPVLSLPPVDLGHVMDRVHSVIEKIQLHDSPEQFCGLGAEIRFGSPVFRGDHVVELNGERISSRSWIIATGSSPTLPSVEGIGGVPYWTNETVFSQHILPKRLLVLGGGPIGLELSQAFCRLGTKVIVIEFLDQILGPEDPDIAKILEKRLLYEGVEIRTNTLAVKAQKVDGSIRLSVSPSRGEGTETVLEADALLVAAGRKPNIDGLQLEAAGILSTPKGITTDARMRTNISHVYACGDVNGQMPFTHVAGYEGGIALTNAVLRLPRKADYTKVGWCTFTDPEVASIGLNEKRARQQNIDYHTIEEHFCENDRALAEGEHIGKIKILVSPKGKLLGCQIIGAHAGELIHEWILTMNAGVKLSSIASAVHVYPTLSEISKRAAGGLFSSKIFSDRTRSVLRLLFNLKGRACSLPEES
ncbi:MAG TPA: NAD(P)/FAD-dependent oxidoreductase [Deltaproteobacteria bacterium]|nr:NAD(P)/FAD-dependent oxidoreductase [Deltaproteobacteria bacterium]